MAHLALSTADYHAADTLLGSRDERRIGHNTRLRRAGDDIAVRYHATDIVTMSADGAVTIDTGGWDTVTTWQRVNALLPGPWAIHSDRGRRSLYYRGHVITPYADGLTLYAADGRVSYAGDTILTADDVAAIVAASEEAAARRAAKHAERMLREHPTARTFAPDHPALPSWAVPAGTGHRGGRGARACDRCDAESTQWAQLRRDRIAADHDAGTHPAPSWSSGVSCPWDCPRR